MVFWTAFTDAHFIYINVMSETITYLKRYWWKSGFPAVLIDAHDVIDHVIPHPVLVPNFDIVTYLLKFMNLR